MRFRERNSDADKKKSDTSGLVIMIQFSLVPPGPIFGKKFTIFCEFGPLLVK